MFKDRLRYLTIKEFSEFTHTSVDTLKHYDRIGLLKPAYVGANSYRYYLPEQSLLLTRILFDTHAGIPLKDIRASFEKETPDDVMAHYEKISESIDRRIAELEAMQGTIRNMRYYYRLTKAHKEKELFSIYLPEWFIIRSQPISLSSEKQSSDSDIANELFRRGFYAGRWPHYLLGACCGKEAAAQNDFSEISYYLKTDHPERFPQKEITFLPASAWYCLIMKVCGKGMKTVIGEFLHALSEKNLAIEGDIFVMDVVNNLLTSRPEHYCTMAYARKKEAPHASL